MLGLRNADDVLNFLVRGAASSGYFHRSFFTALEQGLDRCRSTTGWFIWRRQMIHIYTTRQNNERAICIKK